jgi:hypothetical protein
MTTFEYSGDVNLERGGSFIDLSTWDDGYCTAVCVTDLDSGCGFTGACLIEHVVINGTDNPERLREAMRSCGCSARGMSKEGARLMLADALTSYGYTDPDDSWDNHQSHHTEIVQMEADGPMVFDGWTADKRLNGTGLREYVESVHLRG